MKILLRAIVLLDEDLRLRVYSPGLLEVEEDSNKDQVSFGIYCGEHVDLDLSNLVLLPRHLNGHAHILDLKLRQYFHTYYIDDVVGAPYGIKYLYIKKMNIHDLSQTVKYSLENMLRSGTGKAWIVLEHGLRLHNIVRKYADSVNMNIQLFLEPSRFHLIPDENSDSEIVSEVKSIVRLGYDVEIISPLNYTTDELNEIKQIAHSASKLIMTHVSETPDTYRERDLDLAVDILDADILVHCCYIEKRDLDKLRDRIIVVTPRSNIKLAGKVAPLQDILRLDDIRGILIGTDNIGLYDPNLWDEYRILAAILNREVLQNLFVKVLETTYRLTYNKPEYHITNGQLVCIVNSCRDIVTSIVQGEVLTVGLLERGKVKFFREVVTAI